MTNAAALAFRFRVFIFVSLYVIGFLAPWEFPQRPSKHTLARCLDPSGPQRMDQPVSCNRGSDSCQPRLPGPGDDSARLGHGVSRFRRHARRCDAGRSVRRSRALRIRPQSALPGVVPAGPRCICADAAQRSGFLPGRLQRLRAASNTGGGALPLGEARRGLSAVSPECASIVAPITDSPSRPRHAAPSAPHPRWLQALLAETYPVAITLCFAVLAWRYNARILVQCVLICYGVSLVVRALTGEGRTGGV